MILLRKICLKELADQGRDFNWGKHDCEKCQRPMWGHGFVTRYFAELVSAVFMKRFRCPGCHAVVTVRPEGYLARLRSSIETMVTALRERVASGVWGLGISRQRCGHWLRRFVKKVRMDWGDRADLKVVLEFCFEKRLSFFT
jgi:hypothetical protein